jgi:ABC-2 type transport system ATP-binding protein
MRTTGLGRRYRRRWALRDCTVDVPDGAVVALVGGHGAGKSTLLGLLAGLDAPTAGGFEVPAHVGYLAQERPLYDGLTVAETVRLGRSLNPGRWAAERVARLLDLGGLAGTERVGALPGGRRAVLALAVALGPEPELLLLDEPLAGLDPLVRRQVLGTVAGQVADTGATVLMASHDIADVQELCDHVVLLADGTVRLHGAVEDVLAAHALLDGPADDVGWLAGRDVVDEHARGRQATLLVRDPDLPTPPAGWRRDEPDLGELTLRYLGGAR